MLATLQTSAAHGGPLDGLEASIREAREQWHAPGLAVAIVKDDRTVFAKGFGEKHLGRGDAVDANTVFALASVTKAFVAVSMAMLVDEGRLAWDDPVIRHLPEFRVRDPYVTREVTIRDLLAHRTGIESPDALWLRGFDAPTTLAHLHHAQQESGLRSRWTYNNTMYVVGAQIVARVSGMRFQDFVRARIFEPLGMRDSRIVGAAEAMPENSSGVHLIERGKPRQIDAFVSESMLGAAGISSSAADMTRWLRFLLNAGEVDGKTLIRREVLAECFRLQAGVDPAFYPAAQKVAPTFFAYGLGWFLQDYRGHLLIMHTGSLYGANTLVAFVPDLNLGLVILINASRVEYRHAFMYDVIDRYIGKREQNWNATLRQLYSRIETEKETQRKTALLTRPTGTRPSLPLDSYAGLYSNPLLGEVEIVRSDDRYSLLMRPNLSYSLQHWSYDTFEASDDRAPESRFLMTFRLDGDGRVAAYEASGKTFRRRECVDTDGPARSCTPAQE
jgi:CubicO group peptidase (beta-lactamase class C family)